MSIISISIGSGLHLSFCGDDGGEESSDNSLSCFPYVLMCLAMTRYWMGSSKLLHKLQSHGRSLAPVDIHATILIELIIQTLNTLKRNSGVNKSLVERDNTDVCYCKLMPALSWPSLQFEFIEVEQFNVKDLVLSKLFSCNFWFLK